MTQIREPSLPRIALANLALHLPGRIRETLCRVLAGWEVHRTARIGLSVFVVKELCVGPSAQIGHNNVVRGLRRFTAGELSIVRNGNHVFGDFSATATFDIEDHARVMSRHYFDCSNSITLAKGCEIAGRSSQFITHGQQVREHSNRHVTRAVVVGPQAIVGTGSIVVMAHIAEGVFVAAGAVVTSDLEQPQMIYGGVPARKIKPLPQNAKPLSHGTGGENV